MLQVGVEPEECTVKWKSLRDKFVREYKKVKGGKSGDCLPRYIPTWPLFNLMEFLSDSVQHRRLSLFLDCVNNVIIMLIINYRSETNITVSVSDHNEPEDDTLSSQQNVNILEDNDTTYLDMQDRYILLYLWIYGIFSVIITPAALFLHVNS